MGNSGIFLHRDGRGSRMESCEQFTDCAFYGIMFEPLPTNQPPSSSGAFPCRKSCRREQCRQMNESWELPGYLALILRMKRSASQTCGKQHILCEVMGTKSSWEYDITVVIKLNYNCIRKVIKLNLNRSDGSQYTLFLLKYLYCCTKQLGQAHACTAKLLLH